MTPVLDLPSLWNGKFRQHQHGLSQRSHKWSTFIRSIPRVPSFQEQYVSVGGDTASIRYITSSTNTTVLSHLQSPLPDTAFDFEYSDNFPNDDHPRTRNRPPSVFSAEDAPSIWLADNSNSGSSTGFARDVHIAGWTHVGDKLGGAYIVYDCAITTKEGTVMHTHKRYSAFAQLYAHLRATLPAAQQRFVPPLPPKNPLSKFRATFLDRRRRALQHWLASVLLHPDVGGCEAVRQWVME
ncbi:hypothetical protein EW026_g6972 [Hermanssonia centrifuga]|uniref:Endosomal/vacuolar adapter protein YPT35 n=1 Tax=Hermanssonia centrifuga TaxID=98765 RepID=A0A4S4K9C3_9APHY|nr:hypothetical protein EW026_g6972 [Hermanssonia centrifuga]